MFSLGSIATNLNTSSDSASLPLTVRASSGSGIIEEFIYGTYAPNTPGATNALFLNSVYTNYQHDIVGNSFILDTAPGTHTAEDAPLFPGDAYVNAAWFSPASGQLLNSSGVSNSIERTTTMTLIGRFVVLLLHE